MMDTPVPKTILLVDDESAIRRVLAATLGEDGYRVLTAETGRAAIKIARAETEIEVIVSDYLMPDLSGLETVAEIRKTHPNTRILFLSGHATVRVAVEAMRLGAFDFMVKPFDNDAIRRAVRAAVEAQPFATRPSDRRDRATDKPPLVVGDDYGFLGDAPASRKAKENLLRIAPAQATVLLLGETGVGKEVAARLLHRASPRREKPFVAISCAALPESLLESELFGHEKSAFTGADSAKAGKIEMADGGTLFLDEIGDIPHSVQVKLLRVLQERSFYRIGGTKLLNVNVRVVAATNRDLQQAVHDGTFRADLFYRLNVIPVTLPPLRLRKEDIPLLAARFLALCAGENGRSFAKGMASDACARLCGYDWPGNIRELRNVLEYAVVLAPPDSQQITADSLPEYLHDNKSARHIPLI